MNKWIIFDLDWVLIHPRYFSEKYEKEFWVSPQEITKFFKHDFRKCLTWEEDLKIILLPYLRKWNWNKSVEDFLEYWFSYCSKIDLKLLERIRQLKTKWYKIFVWSDQDKYRSKYIEDAMNLGKEFDAMFFSCNLWVKKSHPDFFKLLSKNIDINYGIKKQDLLFFDDKQINIESAEKEWIKSHIYIYWEIPEINF